jgi:Rod binding domain-containing protein
MDITPIQRKMDASEISPEKLAGNSQFTQKEKIAEASRQFEAMLLRQILESSQKPVIKSKYGDNSASSAIYRDQVTAQMADSISKSGTFGFAKTFTQQLNRPPDAASKTNTFSAAPASHPISSPRNVRGAVHPTFKTP